MIVPGGKSRAFVNDMPVTLATLKDLGERLIDIHSQHRNLILNSSAFQMTVLDAQAGNHECGKALMWNGYPPLTVVSHAPPDSRLDLK
jgi:DNA repair ATPase RecN